MELLEDESQWNQFLHHHGYLLRHQIGYGSFGDVFCVSLASQNDTNTRYALKRLITRRKVLDDEYAMMEIHSLLRLQHQNIVSLREVFLTKNVACIVMELAPLGNLEMFLKISESEVTKDFVALTFNQILNAIEYCHGLSLAHRDINPTNVLVCSSCLVKLADFGLCFQCRDDAAGGSLLCEDYLGQELYTAPEVKRCEPFHAMPADIWSLGCLLSYLATSSHCFENDQPECNSKCVDNHSEILGNANENKQNNPRKSGLTSNFNYELQDYSSCGVVDKRRDACMIQCFIKRLCCNSPKKRPLISQAASEWNEIRCVINCNITINVNCTNSTRTTTDKREE